MKGTLDPPHTARRPALDAFAQAVDGIGDLLAGVAGLPGWTLTEDAALERLGELLAVRAAVDELTARVTASILARDVPRLAGAASAKAWLMTTHGLSSGDAHRLITHTRVADTDQPVCDRSTRTVDPDGADAGDHRVVTGGRCEPTRRAWASGGLSAERAVLVGHAVTDVGDHIPVEATDRLQHHLLRLSPRLTYQQLKTVCRHAVEVVDPDAADKKLEAQLRDAETRALQQAVCRIWKTGDGTTRGTFTIPDLTGDLLLTALNAFAAPRRDPHSRRRDNDPTLADPADGSGSTGEARCPTGSRRRSWSGCRTRSGSAGPSSSSPNTSRSPGCPNTAARTPPWSSPPT